MSELLERARDRRARFMQQLGSGAVLITGATRCRRNADSDYPFRQNSDFHYLTAFPEPDALCVLFAADQRMVLFVPPRDAAAETWTGRRAGVEAAMQQYGADVAYSTADIAAQLPTLLADVETLHYAMGSRVDIDAVVQNILQDHRLQRPRHGKGIQQVHDPTAALHEMRLLKEGFEIDCMRRAVQATDAGHLRILRDCRPGQYEYELQAMLEYEFRRHGASGPAYGTIVGGGDNATILHYVQNDCLLRSGDLVLVDAGAECDLYAADVTRTFPVDGVFSAAQRDLYEVVLDAQRQAIDAIRPGARFTDGHEAAVQRLGEGLVLLKLAAGPVE
jgi:Xaa-Pro aminopeptidase